MRRFVLAAFALTVLAACQPVTTELTEEQKAAIEEEVTLLTTELGEAVQSQDVERWLSSFTDDARWGSHFGPYFGTMEMFKPAVRRMTSMTAQASSELDEMFVRVLGPDAAMVGVTTHGTTEYTNGQSTADTSAMTLVWQRIDGVWRIVHGSANIVNEPVQSSN